MATRNASERSLLRRAWLMLAIVVSVGPSCDGPTSEHHVGTQPATAREEAISTSRVRSSALPSVGYDEDQQALEIEFTNGAVYRYFDVPAEVYRGLMAAESHGRYFHQHVRDKTYRYQRLK